MVFLPSILKCFPYIMTRSVIFILLAFQICQRVNLCYIQLITILQQKSIIQTFIRSIQTIFVAISGKKFWYTYSRMYTFKFISSIITIYNKSNTGGQLLKRFKKQYIQECAFSLLNY